MKKLLLFIFIISLFGCAGTGELTTLGMLGLTSFQNEPDGFRGIKWGQHIKDIPGLKLTTTDNEGLALYTRENDDLQLGDAKLISLHYAFWQDRFMEVQIKASPGQLQALKNVLEEKYDKGFNPYGTFSPIHDYSWYGPVAMIRFQRLNAALNCDVWIRSREVMDSRTAFRSQKAKTGAERGSRQDF